MRRYFRLVLICLVAQLGALGQNVTLGIGSGSGIAGSTVSLPIDLATSGGAQPTALQWSFSYSADITSVTVAAGPSTTNSGKTITCAATICVLSGLNTTVIANGTVAVATFQLAANPSNTVIPVQLSGVAAVSGTASSIPTSPISGSISLPIVPVSVSITPLSVSLAPSQSYQFASTVSGSSNTAVTWSMAPAVGSLSNGLYTAPAAISASQNITITATSVADPSKFASATVQLTPNNVSISMSPPSANLYASQSQQFTATVTGSTNTGVTWSMNPLVGTLLNGLYTAPASISSAQTVTITATSVADPSKSIVATVQLLPLISVTITPTSTTLKPSQTTQFTTTVAGTANTGVTWSINPLVGTLSNGLYTAPSVINSTQTVTITATSVVDTTKSASATVQLMSNGINVSLSPSTVTLSSSQSSQFTANVSGTSNTSVVWSLVPTTGTVSSTGVYTAPAVVSSSQIVTITATSTVDSTKSGSATIQLVPSAVSITINPSKVSLAASGTTQFAVTVSGTTNAGVTWSMSPVLGSLLNGLYTAPATVTNSQNVTVTATSVVDPSQSASAIIHLYKNSNIKLNPQRATLTTSKSVQFTAIVDGTSDGQIVWSNSDALGTVSSSGLYTAPKSVSSPQDVTITGILLPSDGGPAVATSAVVTILPGGTSTPPTVTSISSAASLAGGPISPGEIVAIQGSGIGPDYPATLALDPSGKVTSSLSHTLVLFDGTPAPLLYAQANQINAVVPYSVTPGASVRVEVAYQGTLSNSLTLDVAPYTPALFKLGATQGAIINQDGTANSSDNPAARGEWVSVYGTGYGQTNPPSVDGQVVGLPLPALPVQTSVRVGNIEAEVLYAGPAPSLVSGVLLVNIRIPADAPSGSNVPIVLGMGASSSQSGVTIAIK